MDRDGKHWVLTAEEIDAHEVTIHAPHAAFLNWAETRDETQKLVRLETDSPAYFTLTPTPKA